jgi:two-component system sensor histidine kinase BaeS
MADISHELRTPLAVLRGELEAIQDGVRKMSMESLASLQSEVAILTKLVDDLYQLSLSDAGALAYRKEETDAVHLIQLAEAAFRERFHAKQLHLTSTLPDKAPIFGDPHRLSQLFNNLLENSLRYTDSGGGLDIIATRRDKCLQVYFQDSAPGLNEEQLLRIFERFYRTEGSRNRASGGSGLGLAICQNIVEAHGGKIRAEHSPTGGIRIILQLPLSLPSGQRM